MNANVVGMSFDTPEENKFFADAYQFTFPILSDAERKVGEAYGTKRPDDHEWAIAPRRLSFLIDPEGKIFKTYKVQDLAGHADEVLQDLQEAQS